MAKRAGLHINKKDLDTLISEYVDCTDWCKGRKLINSVNSAYRVKIKKNNIYFYIDIFYRKDNTITVKDYSAKGDGGESKKLVEYIKENSPFKDVPHGEFSCSISQEEMDSLIEYLASIDGVSLIDKIDNGCNGMIYRYTSDIGDNITLTYYATTYRMRFQGCFLKLSTEIKCFLFPIAGIEEQKRSLLISKNQILIDAVINKYLPNSYNNLDALQQDLIHDSIPQMICKPITKDFSVWVFSILKGLEARIKQIFQHNNVTIYDRQGFCRHDRNTDSKEYFFKKQCNKFQLDTSIVSINDVNTINVLGECYDYLNKNRNYLFHTKQIGASRILNSSNKAEKIIYEVMDLFEESYSKLGY